MFTHTVAQPYDKIGFGPRTEGYVPNIEGARISRQPGQSKGRGDTSSRASVLTRSVGAVIITIVRGCRVVIDVADRLCPVDSAVVFVLCSVFPPDT